MKNLILSFILLTVSYASFSQDAIPDLKAYEDADNKLFISKVVELEGKTAKDISQSFKNWASTSFVNLKEVMVSETDNQIVLVYIVTVPLIRKILLSNMRDDLGYYVRLVSEFKDGKVRISLYDDGNTYEAPKSTQYGLVGGNRARSYYMIDRMKVVVKPENEKDFTKQKYAWYPFVKFYQDSLEKTLLSAVEGLKNPTAASPKRKDDF